MVGISLVDGCLNCSDDLLLLTWQGCGGCSAGWVTAVKTAALAVIEILEH